LCRRRFAAARDEGEHDEKKKNETRDRFHQNTSWIFRGWFRDGSASPMLALTALHCSEGGASA
jgi:hypothetical protein